MRTYEEIRADVWMALDINEAEALHRYATELDALGTPLADALASNARGVAFELRGEYLVAHEHLHRALALFEEMDNRSGMAAVTSQIGNVHSDTGDYSAALEHFANALARYEALGDRYMMAGVTSNIGVVHMETGDYPAALEHYHRALAILEELADHAGRATVIGNIGNVYSSTGDYPAALDHYYRALTLHQELGNRDGTARVTDSIGGVYLQTGDYPAALEHYHHALDIYVELDSRPGTAIVTGNIGGVYRETGDYPAALEHFLRALALHDELGERADVALVTGNIVGTYLLMGADAEAQKGLADLDALPIDDPGVRVRREHHRSTLLERNGDLGGAAEALQRALTEALDHGLRAHVAETHKRLRDLSQKRNDFAAYIEHNNEYTRITEEINGKETTTKLNMQAKQREIEAVQREHAQHMAVLHSTLPKHIADRVARGETVNDHYDNAAVIFLDIVGFTTISDRIPSGHVVHLLEQIFTTLDAVCEKHNVVKIKTIGDSYMAVTFQTANSEERTANSEQRTANTGHIHSAAACAIDMIASLDALEITMPPSLGETSWTKDVGDIKVRIGMLCGPVTAGVIGTARMQYDVWGDTVNVASRMESTSEPGRIHVSQALANALGEHKNSPPDPLSHASLERGSHTVIPRGTIDVKGKGTMRTYWLE